LLQIYEKDQIFLNKGNNKITEPSNLPKGKAKLISQQTDKISQKPENWENSNKS